MKNACQNPKKYAVAWVARSLVTSMLVFSAALLSSCERHPSANRLPPLKALKSSKEMEVTPTHVIVRWPARGEAKATTLKIPREYISQWPGWTDDEGGLASINIELDIRGPRPVEQMSIPLKGASQDELDRWDARMRNRVYVVINRDSVAKPPVTQNRINQWGPETGYEPDGEVEGLLRFSKHKCLAKYEKENIGRPVNVEYIAWLKQRAENDLSPPGCRTDRSWTQYMTTVGEPIVTTMYCTDTGCSVYINVASRQANFKYDPEYPRNKNKQETVPTAWRSHVEVAHRLLNSFVVNRDQTAF